MLSESPFFVAEFPMASPNFTAANNVRIPVCGYIISTLGLLFEHSEMKSLPHVHHWLEAMLVTSQRSYDSSVSCGVGLQILRTCSKIIVWASETVS